MKKIKSITAIMLAFALIFTTACSNANEQTEEVTSATADIMRLEKVEGDVEIINADGENIEPFEGMKLQSGYEIATGEDSFAFISLDDSKAIKLDTLSKTSIENDGKHLLITLTSGGLFFNVSQPLLEDETMDIKTSNMITGIRGTSGYIQVYEENGDEISYSTLITGTVGVNVLDETDEKIDGGVVISAGETAVFSQSKEVLEVREITTSEIPNFVKEAIDADEDLQSEIIDNGDFDIDDLVDDLDDDDFKDDDSDENDDNDDDKDDDKDDDEDDDKDDDKDAIEDDDDINDTEDDIHENDDIDNIDNNDTDDDLNEAEEELQEIKEEAEERQEEIKQDQEEIQEEAREEEEQEAQQEQEPPQQPPQQQEQPQPEEQPEPQEEADDEDDD